MAVVTIGDSAYSYKSLHECQMMNVFRYEI